jgi:hypothetical protein
VGGGTKTQLEFQEDQVAFDHEVVFSEIINSLLGRGGWWAAVERYCLRFKR